MSISVEVYYPFLAPYVKNLTYDAVGYGTLVLLALFGMVLVLGIGMFRVLVGIIKGLPVSYWRPGKADEAGFYRRLMRCHANTFENIGFYLAVILAALHFQEAIPLELFKILCATVLIGRVGQTFVYLVGESTLFVLVRFAFFALQKFSVSFMAYRVLLHIFSGGSGCVLPH